MARMRGFQSVLPALVAGLTLLRLPPALAQEAASRLNALSVSGEGDVVLTVAGEGFDPLMRIEPGSKPGLFRIVVQGENVVLTRGAEDAVGFKKALVRQIPAIESVSLIEERKPGGPVVRLVIDSWQMLRPQVRANTGDTITISLVGDRELPPQVSQEREQAERRRIETEQQAALKRRQAEEAERQQALKRQAEEEQQAKARERENLRLRQIGAERQEALKRAKIEAERLASLKRQQAEAKRQRAMTGDPMPVWQPGYRNVDVSGVKKEGPLVSPAASKTGAVVPSHAGGFTPGLLSQDTLHDGTTKPDDGGFDLETGAVPTDPIRLKATPPGFDPDDGQEGRHLPQPAASGAHREPDATTNPGPVPRIDHDPATTGQPVPPQRTDHDSATRGKYAPAQRIDQTPVIPEKPAPVQRIYQNPPVSRKPQDPVRMTLQSTPPNSIGSFTNVPKAEMQLEPKNPYAADATLNPVVRQAWQDLLGGNAAGAELSLRNYLEKTPDDPVALTLLADVLLKPVLEGLAMEDASSPASGTARANEARREAARQELLKVVAKRPYLPAYTRLVELYLDDGKPDDATRLWDKVSGLYPDEPVVAFERGNLNEALGNLPAARDAYAKALSAQPDNVEFHYRLAQLEMKAGRPDAARWELLQGLRNASDDARLWKLLAYITQKQGDSRQALQFYRMAAQPDALINCGRLLEGQNQPEQAQIMYQAAESVAGDDPDILYNLGLIYAGSRQTDRATRALNRFLELEKGTQDPRVAKAQSTLKQLTGKASNPNSRNKFLPF